MDSTNRDELSRRPTPEVAGVSHSPASVAAAYDARAQEYDWRGPEVAFGLSYRYVQPGESLLDIGIGTGLSSYLRNQSGPLERPPKLRTPRA
jgi:hypothetical protein